VLVGGASIYGSHHFVSAGLTLFHQKGDASFDRFDLLLGQVLVAHLSCFFLWEGVLLIARTVVSRRYRPIGMRGRKGRVRRQWLETLVTSLGCWWSGASAGTVVVRRDVSHPPESGDPDRYWSRSPLPGRTATVNGGLLAD
jgi:hypothetical protein